MQRAQCVFPHLPLKPPRKEWCTPEPAAQASMHTRGKRIYHVVWQLGKSNISSVQDAESRESELRRVKLFSAVVTKSKHSYASIRPTRNADLKNGQRLDCLHASWLFGRMLPTASHAHMLACKHQLKFTQSMKINNDMNRTIQLRQVWVQQPKKSWEK